MSEQQPSFQLSGYECTPDNTSLFMFWGDLASRNHVFVVEDEPEGEVPTGTHLFDPDNNWFDGVAAHMINNGFTAHINLHEVAECDEDAYQRYVEKRTKREAEEIGDFIPESWEDGEA